MAVEGDGAGSWFDEAKNHPPQRSLAAAGFTYQTECFTLIDLERDTVDSADFARGFAKHTVVSLVNLDQLEDGKQRHRDHYKTTHVQNQEYVVSSRDKRSKMTIHSTDNRGLLEALLGNGRFLLQITGMALVISGGFAIAQSISGQLLPHDVHALGMDTTMLRQQTNANLVRFMFHDRVAFGGALLAIGTAYWWLAEFPLRQGSGWAWWVFAVSGGSGFLSFLAYLGYGYLDTWHGVATLFLLPVYFAGMWRARKLVHGPLSAAANLKSAYRPESGTEVIGRRLLLACGLGLVVAGLAILVVGMTFVFVRQDVQFIGISAGKLQAVSPVLVPLLAHDRAGFGGGLLSVGLILVMIVRYAALSRSLVQVIAVMGLCGFGAALGVHFAIGYTSFIHLSPAYLGFLIFLSGTLLLAKENRRPRSWAGSN